jgi:myo-inositol-1(or 4)-monophosphatase
VCQAAGCIVTDLLGQPLHSSAGLVAAADPTTHQQLIKLIGRRLEPAE